MIGADGVGVEIIFAIWVAVLFIIVFSFEMKMFVFLLYLSYIRAILKSRIIVRNINRYKTINTFITNSHSFKRCNKRCREIVKIRKHKEHTNPYEEVEAIRRNIQNHLTQDKYYEAWKVPSQYMYAYSIILDCSLDYLYGTSEIMSSDLEVADICQKTGLSEDAVNCLVENMPEDDADPDEENVFSYTSWWSNLLCGDSYYAIPISWFSYASRIVEMNDITKQIRGSDRAEKEVEISDVYTSLLFNEDGKHKSLQIK